MVAVGEDFLCGNCQFWIKLKDLPAIGFCHLHPPVLTVQGNDWEGHKWDFPRTNGDLDWCGQFEYLIDNSEDEDKDVELG